MDLLHSRASTCGDRDIVGLLAHDRAGHVISHVATADDDHLAAQWNRLSQGDTSQKLDAADHTRRIEILQRKSA